VTVIYGRDPHGYGPRAGSHSLGPQRGGIAYLIGKELPDVCLPFLPEEGDAESLARMARRHALVCFYPGLANADTEHNSNKARVRHWNQHEETLRALDHTLVVVTSEPAETQIERAYQMQIHHPILSDPDLRVACELGLPTRRYDETTRVYEPTTIVVRERLIVAAFHPAGPDDASMTTDWVRRNYGV
jgi:peroxiredoxin